MINKRLIIALVIILAILSIPVWLFHDWMVKNYETPIESWGPSYSFKEENMTINNSQEAFIAIINSIERENEGDNSTYSIFVNEFIQNLTVDDICFGTIKNVDLDYNATNDEVTESLDVWILMKNIPFHLAIDHEGNIYSGGILPYAMASNFRMIECPR